MSNYPTKFLPFYLTASLLFFSASGFCAQSGLTEMQKQARLYRDKGCKLQQEDKIEEASSYYQKAILLDHGYAIPYNDVGIILEAMGQPEQAKQMYLKAIEIDQNYPNSYSNLALLYEEQKDYANAILYWIKRATLGDPQDPWAKMARRHVEDIARIYPEAYCNIPEQYKENLRQQEQKRLKQEEIEKKKQELALQKKKEKEHFLQEKEQKRLKQEEEKRLREEKKQKDKQLAEQKPQQALSKDTTLDSQKIDNKTRALNHLALAKKSFSKGDYVAALKEATVAEYFDSSNEEISAFVDAVRKKLLK